MLMSGLVGCETALWLKDMGKNVTIVEALPKLLAVNGPLCHANSEMLKELIPFKGIKTITSAKATGYDGKMLRVNTPDGEINIAADTVILAVGYTPSDSLYKEVKDEIPNVYLIGDAGNVSNIMYAIWNAFEVAKNID
ncbi:MAG: 2-enoate reductase [Thermoanaerobacterium sp.]|nr:2-enoate reductase [Thermoanaerobacterium sp.]